MGAQHLLWGASLTSSTSKLFDCGANAPSILDPRAGAPCRIYPHPGPIPAVAVNGHPRSSDVDQEDIMRPTEGSPNSMISADESSNREGSTAHDKLQTVLRISDCSLLELRARIDGQPLMLTNRVYQIWQVYQFAHCGGAKMRPLSSVVEGRAPSGSVGPPTRILREPGPYVPCRCSASAARLDMPRLATPAVA